MNKHDRVVLVTGIVVLAAMLLSAFAFGSNEIAAGTMNSLSDRWFDKLDLQHETLNAGGRMAGEGQTETFDISGEMRAIKNITATVNWQDEPDQRQVRMYLNQPDQFSVTILNPNGTTMDSGSGSNERTANGGEGEIQAQASLDVDEMNLYRDSGNWTVEVTLQSIGDYEARVGAGLWPITPEDSGNDFDIMIEIEYYDLAED